MGMKRVGKAILSKAGWRLPDHRTTERFERWPVRGTLPWTLRRTIGVQVPDGAVDLGAGCGEWSMMLRRLGFGGPILTVEPVADTYEQLLSAVADDPLISTTRMAVGNRRDSVVMHISESPNWASILPVNDYAIDRFPPARIVGTELVEMAPVDDLSVPEGRLLLKIDVQGIDLSVIDGAPKTLARTVIVQCEMAVVSNYQGVDNLWQDVIERLDREGFALAGLHGVSWDKHGRQSTLDGLFVRVS